jgi:hypothetical protein
MSTFAQYEIRDQQSGRLFFGPDTKANCVAAAPAIQTAYLGRQMNIIPTGYSNGSDRPLPTTPVTINAYS